MTTHLTIKPAVISDAEHIARVQMLSHRETYSHLVPAESLYDDSWLVERSERWEFHITNETFLIFTAQVDGKIVGWVNGGNVENAVPPYSWELKGLYLLAEYHGSGAGQQLLDSVMQGKNGAFLWKADDNPRAERFYERNGFIRDGETSTAELYNVPVKLARMVKNAV